MYNKSPANQSVEPISIADVKLTDKVLKEPENWIFLRYMPHLESISSLQRCAFSGKSDSIDFMIRDYHRCLLIMLDLIFKSMKECPFKNVKRGKNY